MNEYLDSKNKPIHIGDNVMVVARTRTHKDRNLELIGRVGRVIRTTPNGNIIVRLHAKGIDSKLNDSEGTYFSEELFVVEKEQFTNPISGHEPIDVSQKTDTPIIPKHKTMKPHRKQNNINISKLDYELFERFFQYGNFKNAKYIFVGMEEGLGHEDLSVVIDSRKRWSTGEDPFVQFFHDKEPRSGSFYTNDLEAAAWDVTKESFQHDYQLFKQKLKIDGVMNSQARIKCLIDSNFEFLLLPENKQIEAIRKCFFDSLHKPNSDTAMFERYPLPKQGKFSYIVDGIPFSDYESYISYNDQLDNNRTKMIMDLYEEFPMPVSIVYAGIKDRKFKLLPFYQDILKFNFKDMTTHQINPISDLVNPVSLDKAKQFKIGTRCKKDGSIQHVVLTPFFGVGQISHQDIDVITTWIAGFEN